MGYIPVALEPAALLTALTHPNHLVRLSSWAEFLCRLAAPPMALGIEQRNKYLDDIDSRFHELAETPDYPTSKNREEIRKGCFSVFVNQHVIIYRKFSYGVRIVRVLKQSMDIKQYL